MRGCIFFIFLCFTLAYCAHSKNNAINDKIDSTLRQVNNKIPSIQKQEKTILENPPTFEKAHPNAKLLMNEDFYFSRVDEAAPFGNPDGANAYAGFQDWRQKHKQDLPIDFLTRQIDHLGYPAFDINETDFLKLQPYLHQHEFGSRFISGTDAVIVAIAFGQLYLEGTIDKSLKETAKTAIRRQLIPQFLIFWGDPDRTERMLKLTKMLAVLDK